jgi:hypothetical protein
MINHAFLEWTLSEQTSSNIGKEFIKLFKLALSDNLPDIKTEDVRGK